jgi:hypothetical protein
MSDRDFEWDFPEDIDVSSADVDFSARTTVGRMVYPVGLHVKTTAGIVECVYARPNNAAETVTEGIYVALGDYVKIKVMKVLSTSTAAGIVGLFRSKKPGL